LEITCAYKGKTRARERVPCELHVEIVGLRGRWRPQGGEMRPAIDLTRIGEKALWRCPAGGILKRTGVPP